MSVLSDFLVSEDIRFNDTDVDLFQPPKILGVDLFSPFRTLFPLGCVPKAAGSSDVTLTILGVRMPFTGTYLGVDARGRSLFRYRIDDMTPQLLGGHLAERIEGELAIAVEPLDPIRREQTCANTDG